jgi:hypothetical protein
MVLGLFPKNPANKYRNRTTKTPPSGYPVRSINHKLETSFLSKLNHLKKRYLNEKLGSKANLKIKLNKIKRGEFLRRLGLLRNLPILLERFGKTKLENMSNTDLPVMFVQYYQTLPNFGQSINEFDSTIHHLQLMNLLKILAKSAENQSKRVQEPRR